MNFQQIEIAFNADAEGALAVLNAPTPDEFGRAVLVVEVRKYAHGEVRIYCTKNRYGQVGALRLHSAESEG